MPPSLSDLMRSALQRLNLTQCACCGLGHSNPLQRSRTSRWICGPCLNLLQADQRKGCIQCGLRLGERLQAFGWTRCRHCRTRPNKNIQTTVVQDYLPPFSNWILSLKYRGDVAKATLLGDFLLDQMSLENSNCPDVLVPSPISENRLKERGYNQAELIAKHLGRELGLPVKTHWLKKIKDTAQQSNSSKSQREENLRNAIICTKPLVSSIKIGLVDDVITTGSTLHTCAQVMRKAGASHFQFFAICRTPE